MRNLGVLWIIYGLLRLITALGVFMWSGTLTLMWGALLSRVPNPFALMDDFHAFLILAIIIGTAAGIIAIVAGLALMSSGASARKLGIVAAFFGLLRPDRRSAGHRPGSLHLGCAGARWRAPHIALKDWFRDALRHHQGCFAIHSPIGRLGTSPRVSIAVGVALL